MITVVGRADGREVVTFALDHGDDPRDVLANRGWAAGAVAVSGVLERLVLAFDVTPAEPRTPPARPAGPGLSAEDRYLVDPRQRVAAYAVVLDADRLLLTQLSSRTGAEGRWTLPGGGVDPGEAPVEAVVREVREETGQDVVDVHLLDVMTAHWVGRSDRGAEDYHAVRLVHRARCPRPGEPVVHDVGGSTSDARWVPLEGPGGLDAYRLVPTVRWALRAADVA